MSKNVILEIMKEIHQRIENIENQEKLLTEQYQKDGYNQQKIAYQESLLIVSQYLNKKD